MPASAARASAGARLVGRDADDERLAAVHGVQQRLQVRPRPRREDADPQRPDRPTAPRAQAAVSSLGYIPPVERRRARLEQLVDARHHLLGGHVIEGPVGGQAVVAALHQRL